jgi:hypothetical protein
LRGCAQKAVEKRVLIWTAKADIAPNAGGWCRYVCGGNTRSSLRAEDKSRQPTAGPSLLLLPPRASAALSPFHLQYAYPRRLSDRCRCLILRQPTDFHFSFTFSTSCVLQCFSLLLLPLFMLRPSPVVRARLWHRWSYQLTPVGRRGSEMCRERPGREHFTEDPAAWQFYGSTHCLRVRWWRPMRVLRGEPLSEVSRIAGLISRISQNGEGAGGSSNCPPPASGDGSQTSTSSSVSIHHHTRSSTHSATATAAPPPPPPSTDLVCPSIDGNSLQFVEPTANGGVECNYVDGLSCEYSGKVCGVTKA